MEVTRNRWTRLARALCLLLVLAPILTTAAQAKSLATGPPSAIFHSQGAGLGATSPEGFEITMESGEWRHDGHSHLGASGSMRAPWGEEMPVRFWINPDGSFAVEYDGDTIHYTFDEFGTMDTVTALIGPDVVSTRVGGRAQHIQLGAPVNLELLDFAPYEALFESLASKRSEAFLDGARGLVAELGTTAVPAPVGCIGDTVLCVAAVLGWVASVPAIAAGCTVGGILTLGAGCLAAVIAHEAAGATVIGACTNAIDTCSDTGDEHGDPSNGCSGPGGIE